MKKNLPILILLGAIAPLLIGSSSAQEPSVIYRETFGNNHTTSAKLSDSGYIATDWRVYAGAAGTDRTNELFTVSNGTGSPTDLDNIGTGFSTTSETNGFIFAGAANGAQLYATTGHSFDVDNVTQFSWRQYQNHGNDRLRLVVQIDNGQWYATSSGFGPFGSWNQATFNFTPAAASWLELDFAPDSTLALGGIIDTALNGTITSFGLLTSSTDKGLVLNNTMRFDTFTLTGISTIPEPGSIAFILASIAMCFTAINRRSRVRI